ncbi:MAG: NADH-quinone oxidoreductase subunit L [Gammaproteobacteria bacterium]|nr:NADH-quinone oxidoreductase subunit L [Gammaproteobacteria bacterium]NIR82803.1 NADH-quinone oxidoreductase subunit L [Gammaproteobacteria bacterium]NIR89912.1 NADH-quinone oxidoreductase subunit L [Gammaproteobacteria bacterium]NIU03961.1 NADH-quinone oxidoreductase subunit L [Gammaproteobacteria bacterium]NIV51281.1 NADH-quinone oxidoreductase subunit L [Gammaproteobacteria bacterium]
MEGVYLSIVLAPLTGAILAGLFGQQIGRSGAHWVTIIGVGISTLLSAVVFKHIVWDGAPIFDGAVYTWAVAGGVELQLGFLIDELTATMILVVSFVSLMVHIYTIGYMHDDPGYQRFFSYIALFTFGMLMLVMANNFLQLFFGWETVGLMSYLLIGFWYTRESATRAQLKAFLLNRVGDFGFILGIAAVLLYFGTLQYAPVFANASLLEGETIRVFPGTEWSVATSICILLFLGAMGKSAQVPLHVWLPDSMEGPTPISALIHAATMVTAGIFMVARMSPLFELSQTALSMVMVVGAVTAFFMGLLGIVENDIKRVIAYSTLSQLGYMAVALGASAYAAAIFHLGTHAFFKALLFLAAGSVIIALHHEQDMRNMGGLRKYMPITWLSSLVGALALIGLPGFSGFFSKDAIIEAVHHSEIPGSGFAYLCVLTGVFVTALYTFRLYFLVFHGKERMDEHARAHLHESPPVVTVPLVLLAIPSVVVGWFWVQPMLFGGHFGESLTVAPEHDVLAELGRDFHGALAFAVHGLQALPFWLGLAGAAVAWFLYVARPEVPGRIASSLELGYRILVDKYGFDRLYENLLTSGGRGIGSVLWQVGDARLIDGLMVNGSARAVGWFSAVVRHVQSGFLYHYAFAMIIGLLALLSWFVYA